MYPDPDTAFRRRMSEYGLHPGPIRWDGRLHHLPGEGKAEKNPKNKFAWYVGFPDRSGGQFGDFSQGLEEVNWQMKRDRPPTRAEREEWTRLDKEGAKRQAEAHARAVKEVQAAWEAAVPADTVRVHPYLEEKRIVTGISDLRVLRKDTPSLKILGNSFDVFEAMLLIPMRKEHDQLVNVQIVLASGSKRYWPVAEVVGASCPVEHDDVTSNLVYLCEDWVTAWSISKCAAALCIATFTPGGLLAEAKWLRSKYGNRLKYIIAADNDRWTDLNDDTPNPGFHFARLAAEALGASLAVPDFKDLSGRPTNFNDLHRLEGKRAVKKWLDPRNVDQAVTVPEIEEPEREPRPDAWPEPVPFRCLGRKSGIYYYLPDTTGQLVELRAGQHTRKHLVQLAPVSWWKREFLGEHSPRSAASWYVVGERLMRQCHKIGIINPDCLRGRGFWRDEDGGIVAHLGDRLLPPGEKEFVKPERYVVPDRIYTRLHRLAGPSEKEAMRLEETRKLLEGIISLAWADEAAGYLLAGWVALAPFSGALAWRPHIWLAGSSGSGKTTVIREMVLPLLGDMCLNAKAGTTAAGIRKALDGDALPIVLQFDDAEYPRTKRAQTVVRDVVLLAQVASSSIGRVRMGKKNSFEPRWMFLLFSKTVGLHKEADKSRFCVLGLTEPRQQQFPVEVIRHFTVQAGRRLMARTAQWLRRGKLDELMTVTRSAAYVVLEDARAADQVGTLAAGAWTLLTDEIPAEHEVVDWFRSLGLKPEPREPDGYELLSKLFQERIAGQTVGHLIRVASAPADASFRDANATLYQHGIKVQGLLGERQFVIIASKSDFVRRSFGDTDWVEILRRLPGARPGQNRFGPSMGVCATTVIPLALAIGEELRDRTATA